MRSASALAVIGESWNMAETASLKNRTYSKLVSLLPGGAPSGRVRSPRSSTRDRLSIAREEGRRLQAEYR